MNTAQSLHIQVRAIGESVDMCDCKLGRTIIMAKREALIVKMRSAMGREYRRRNASYMGRSF